MGRGLARLLIGLVVLGAGCTGTLADRSPNEPTGCCCASDNCRPALSQEACSREAQFQGWTYTWHPGDCTASDTFPALNRPAK